MQSINSMLPLFSITCDQMEKINPENRNRNNQIPLCKCHIWIRWKPGSYVHVNILCEGPPLWPLLPSSGSQLHPVGSFHCLFIQTSKGSGLFCNVSYVNNYFRLGSLSSPADLQVGRVQRPARPRPRLGRWAAASPARRPRPLWLLRSYPPSTPLETLRPPSPARSVSRCGITL